MVENIYIGILSALLGIINFLFWGRIKRIEKDIEEEKSKSSSIEKNYLTRFEELHMKLNEMEKNIIKEIYDIKLLAMSKQHSGERGPETGV